MALYATESGKIAFNHRLLSQMRNADAKPNEILCMLENIDVKNLIDSAGMTLLHHAANAGNETIVKYLIDQGCEVDVLDNCGNTPLMEAVKCKHESVISILLESNADILLCGQGKRNPLAMALAPEYIFMVDTVSEFFDIVKRNISADSRQIAKILMDAECPLPRAIHFKDASIIEYMLDAGCDINDRDPYYRTTALHEAVEHRDPLSVKLLLERGADISAEDKYECTPSDYFSAGTEDSYEVLIALLHHDTSLNASTVKGYKITGNVFQHGQIKEIEAILRYDFDFDDSTWDEYGHTLLHFIVRNENPGVLEQLKGRKFDVHARDNEGKTALWFAAEYMNPSSLEFLFKHGANPNDVNNEGKSVFFHYFKKWTTPYRIYSSTARVVKCIETFLEYGVDVLRKNNETGDTIFDIPVQRTQFVIIQPIISQVALMVATGKCVNEDITGKILNDQCYKGFFIFCTRKIGRLQRTWINEMFTLFQFLTESEEKLLRYVRNHKAAKQLEQLISADRRASIFIVNFLRKRLQKILRIAKLRKEAASIISRISGCDNVDVLEMIVSLLDEQSLKNVCQAIYSFH